MNIFDEVTMVEVDISKCTPEEKEKLIKEGFGDPEYFNNDVILSLQEIEDLGLEAYANYESSWIDGDELRLALTNSLGNECPYYLVFASGCTWDGKSGYTFCDDIVDTVARNYEISLYIDDPKPQNNIIKCTEASHDVPTGSTTYILGLTNEEYNLLKEYNFKQIEEYVEDRFNLEQNREKIAERIEKFMFTPEYDGYTKLNTTPFDTACNIFNIVYSDIYEKSWRKDEIIEDLKEPELQRDLMENLEMLRQEYQDRAVKDDSGLDHDHLVDELTDIIENDMPKILSQSIEYDNLEDFDLTD